MIKVKSLKPQVNPHIFPIVMLSLLAHSTLSGGRVVSSLFVLQQGYSEMLAGVTYGLYGLMPALLSLHMGRLVDRIGPKTIMRVSLLLIIIGMLLPALYLSIETVLVCAAFSGLGFGGYILSAQTSVSVMKVVKDSDRTGMFAWLQVGTSLSAITGPIIVGLLIDNKSFSGVYATLVIVVGMGLVGSFCAHIPETNDAVKKMEKIGVVQQVLKNRSLLRVYLLSMSAYFAWDCFSFMVPVLGVERGYSATDIGLVLSCFALGTLVVRAIMPWFSGNISELKTLSISYALSAFVFVLLALTSNVAVFCLLGLFFGMLAGLWHPNAQNLIVSKVGPQRAGEASGLRLMSGNLSGMSGTTVSGLLTASIGFTPVLFSIALVMAMSSWLANRGDST